MNDTRSQAIESIGKEIAELQKLLKTEKTRKRGLLVKRLHDLILMVDRNYRFTSQAGQDYVIDMLLRAKHGGTFIDVGGYDGITGSNTFFFEIFRNWKGVLVEPVPAQLEKARKIRRCECLGVAVAASGGEEAELIEITEGYTQMSGLKETMEDQMLEVIRGNSRHKERTIKVQTSTLHDIMEQSGITAPDFVSLDIEGGEIPVLENFDFEKYPVGIWAIENNSRNKKIPEIMRANGYHLVEFCGVDEIYQRAK